MENEIVSFYFKGKRPEEFGVFLYDLPEIKSANEKYTQTNISGRMGSLITPSGTTPNIEIKCTLSVLNERVVPIMRDLKEWLLGQGNLSFTETPDSYYEVLWVNHGDVYREIRKYGRFTVTFICTPYEFEITGKESFEIPLSGILNNPFQESMPVYKITGEGMCTLTVNGNEMTANVGQNLTIDTRRMSAYRTDGTVMNTSVTGDYDDLHLLHGSNEISVSSGFQLEVIPYWGWKA